VAGSFQVSPVRATLSAAHSIQALTVRNDGTEPAVIQVELMAWSQQEGKDVYVPSKDIIATPPIFTVPRGRTQIVRVGLRRAPDPRAELAYRIYLQEVPPAPAPGFQGLQVALRLGVPVFVNPASPVAPIVKWRARRGAGGELTVGLANSGNAHVQVTDLALAGARGDALVSRKAVAYVLAGQSREWSVKASPMPARRRDVAPGRAVGRRRAEGRAGVGMNLRVAAWCIALLLWSVGHVHATQIAAASVVAAADHTRIILESDAPIPFNLSVLRNPDRLVLDLEGVEADSVAKALAGTVATNDPT
jgi:fimbrial chaperone protein